MLEFKGWPKIPRLSKSLMVITEKIDGTNAAVGIMRLTAEMRDHPDLSSPAVKIIELEDSDTLPHEYMVYAQSRKRIISPFDDNFGFAKWVADNAKTLVWDLGPGLHFGEWWGLGIQRGYGLSKKYFSLFNSLRWLEPPRYFETPNMICVPELRRHTFDTEVIRQEFTNLGKYGSEAVPGWTQPEGIVIHVPDFNASWKMTYEGDNHKSIAVEADAA